MTEPAHEGPVIRNVAIATDFSPWSERATQHALVVAHRFGAVLHFLHTVRRSEFCLVPGMMVQLDELAERDSDQMIDRLNAGHRLDNTEYHCWQMDGEVSAGFGDFVREHKIDLLILGTRGRSGISKLLLGSVAEEIIHYVCCPVLTSGPWSRRAAREPKLNRVLFATDLSAESFAAIPYVLTAAKTWQAAIDVLHVCSAATSKCRDSMERVSRTIDSFTSGEQDLSVRYLIQPGAPSATVLNFAQQNNEDLVVLGLDRHRSLYSGPPLSHAYEIVRQSKCPVLSVRS